MEKIIISLNTAEAVDNVITCPNSFCFGFFGLNTAEAVDNVIFDFNNGLNDALDVSIPPKR